MKKRKENLREKGITLVALVVTIIILLILAGVTLKLAIGDRGLFKMAQNAVDAYEQSAKNEALDMEGVEKYLSELEGGTPTTPPPSTPEETKPDRSKLKIGDEVNYTPVSTKSSYNLSKQKSGYTSDQPLTTETYTWKIMNIDSDTGTVEIMGVPSSSNTYVYLKGPTGYNNGVYLLNDICNQLYSNSDLDAAARSLKIEDITDHFNDTGKSKITQYNNGNKTYGQTQTYTSSNAYYPELAKYEKNIKVDNEDFGSLTESEDGTSLGTDKITIPLNESDLSSYSASKEQASSSLTVKQTYYDITPDKTYFEDNGELYTNLFFTSGTYYWLASRYSRCYSPHTDFGLRYVCNGGIRGSYLFSSNDGANGNDHCLAPVVSLGSNIQFTGGSDSGWTPTKQ